MEIEFADSKLETVMLSNLSFTDVFTIPADNHSDICMFIGDDEYSGYRYIILGDAPEICETHDISVRKVKAKLIVEI